MTEQYTGPESRSRDRRPWARAASSSTPRSVLDDVRPSATAVGRTCCLSGRPQHGEGIDVRRHTGGCSRGMVINNRKEACNARQGHPGNGS